MKQSNIEQFITENRAAFDSEMPSHIVWEGVEKMLPGKRVSIYRVLRVAAAVALILGLGIVIGKYTAPTSEQELVLSDISQEYAELEDFYTQKINYKIDLLKAQKPNDKALTDIQELEKEFDLLKKELRNTQNDEQIIHAMIENYRTKIDILERVLDRINYATKTLDNEKDI